MPPRFHAASLAVAAALFATPALAQWPQSQTITLGYNGSYYGVQAGQLIPDPEGNGIYPLLGGMGQSHTWSWSRSRLRSNGEFAWASHLVGFNPADTESPMNPDWTPQGFVPTGAGRSISFSGYNSYLTVTAADSQGVFAPTRDTLARSLTLGSGGVLYRSCARDGGGAYVAWDTAGKVRLLRLDALGKRDPGWPMGGLKTGLNEISLSEEEIGFDVAPDGSGGVLLVFAKYDVSISEFSVLVQRFSDAGGVAPGWPAAGLKLSGPYIPVTLPSLPRLQPGDATHFYAVWQTYDYNARAVVAQRFGLDGSLDPAWPAAGVLLGLPPDGGNGLWSLNCVGDGQGGLTAGWSIPGRYQLVHVRADGTFPGLYAGGPLTAFAERGHPNAGAGSPVASLARGRDDGAVVVFPRGVYPSGGSIHARWLDGEGQSPGCSPGDTCSVLLQADVDAITAPAALSDGAGGVYYVWGTVIPNVNSFQTVNMSHADYMGIATTSVSPPAAASLALSLSPNPAHGSLVAHFALANDGPARLELLDIAGRRVRAFEVRGSGAHAERLDGLGAFAPGVYLVRVTQGAEIRTARAVIVR